MNDNPYIKMIESVLDYNLLDYQKKFLDELYRLKQENKTIIITTTTNCRRTLDDTFKRAWENLNKNTFETFILDECISEKESE